MTYELILRSRISEDMPIEEKHLKFMKVLTSIEGPWGIHNCEYPRVPDIGYDPLVRVSLTKYFPKGVKGEVVYNYRGGLIDAGISDDHFLLEFNPKRVDYQGLIESALTKYIEGFDSYFLELQDDEVSLQDWLTYKANTRNTVIRINPANYFDRELCKRAFQLSPEEIKSKLADRVYRSEVIKDGILIILSPTLLTVEEAEKAHIEIMQAIKIQVTSP